MELKRICIVILLAATACGDSTPSAPTVRALVGTGCAVAPTLTGDARLELQSWIDSSCGDIPPGAYTVGVPTGTGVKIGLNLGAGESLTGDGVTINFVGEALNDWHGIQVSGDGARIAGDIRLSTATLYTHSEQSHVIEVAGLDVEISGVTFFHPIKPDPVRTKPDGMPADMKGGDCIRFLGRVTPQRLVGGVVHHNYFEWCDRSNVAGQYGTKGLELHHNVHGHTGDSVYDFEVTVAGPVGDISIHDETIIDTTLKGRPCISVSAQPGPIDNIRIERVAAIGCSYDALNATNVKIRESSFAQLGPGPGMTLRKATDQFAAYNTIVSALTTNAVRISSINGTLPGSISFEDSELETQAPLDPVSGNDNVIDATDVLSLALVNTTLHGLGNVGIGVRGPLRPVALLSVVGSNFVGPFAACTNGNNVSSTVLVGNTHGPDPDNWSPIPTCTGLMTP